jgi:hypothetical protein
MAPPNQKSFRERFAAQSPGWKLNVVGSAVGLGLVIFLIITLGFPAWFPAWVPYTVFASLFTLAIGVLIVLSLLETFEQKLLLSQDDDQVVEHNQTGQSEKEDTVSRANVGPQPRTCDE